MMNNNDFEYFLYTRTELTFYEIRNHKYDIKTYMDKYQMLPKPNDTLPIEVMNLIREFTTPIYSYSKIVLPLMVFRRYFIQFWFCIPI